MIGARLCIRHAHSPHMHAGDWAEAVERETCSLLVVRVSSSGQAFACILRREDCPAPHQCARRRWSVVVSKLMHRFRLVADTYVRCPLVPTNGNLPCLCVSVLGGVLNYLYHNRMRYIFVHFPGRPRRIRAPGCRRNDLSVQKLPVCTPCTRLL